MCQLHTCYQAASDLREVQWWLKSQGSKPLGDQDLRTLVNECQQVLIQDRQTSVTQRGIALVVYEIFQPLIVVQTLTPVRLGTHGTAHKTKRGNAILVSVFHSQIEEGIIKCTAHEKLEREIIGTRLTSDSYLSVI